MESQPELQHPHSHRFTLRIWEEALGEGKAEWRGRVQEIDSGETAFFRDWPGLIATLTRMTGGPFAEALRTPGGPVPPNEGDS